MLDFLMENNQSDIFKYLILPLIIFFGRILDVTLGTFRIVMVAKGNKFYAPILGFFEVLIWILIIGSIMQNLDNWLNIIAYAAGFAAGNLVGLIIEERVAMGIVRVQIITKKPATELIQKLIEKKYGITHHEAEGANGNVNIIYSIINRKKLKDFVEIIRSFNPKAFYTVEDVKFVSNDVTYYFSLKRRIRKGK
ncbi:MAG: DUF2179 domain-containing protein [Prolixibacteraceae bacterium]|nr:DUF2179 domain-containing protein [Prolixibacteraceae bacterium]